MDKLNYLLLLSPRQIIEKLNVNNIKVEKLLRHAKFQKLQNRYFGFQSLILSSEINKLIKNDCDETLYSLDLNDVWDSIDSENQLRKLQIFDLQTYLPGDLMYKADIATMANGLELRSPLLDYRVAEFGLSLPDEYKLKSGVSKRILRDLLFDLVPRNLVDRPKMGFAIPRASWLRYELEELVNDTLLSGSAFIQDYFNMNMVSQAISQHKKGINMDRFIWPILMFELWAKNWTK